MKVTTAAKGTALVLRNCDKKESTEFSKVNTKDTSLLNANGDPLQVTGKPNAFRMVGVKCCRYVFLVE